jgi:hypothetical protein
MRSEFHGMDPTDKLIKLRTAALHAPPMLQMHQPALGIGLKYREEIEAIADSRYKADQAKAVKEVISALTEDATRLENGEHPKAASQNGSIAMLN